MLEISHFVPSQATPQNLQNPLTAGTLGAENARVVDTLIPQQAIEEFALRFNTALLAMVAENGMSKVSPPGKMLKAYAKADTMPVKTTSRLV